MGERSVLEPPTGECDKPGYQVVEELVVAGDLNGNVGMDRAGYERWHG